MNQRLRVLAASTVLAVLAGCSGGPSKAEQDQLKQQFGQKTVDINQVPANEKQRVQGFIDRANAMRAGGKAKGLSQ